LTVKRNTVTDVCEFKPPVIP